MRYKEKKLRSKFHKKQKQVTVRVYNDMVEFEAIETVHDGERLSSVLLSKEEWIEVKEFVEEVMRNE